MRLGRLALDARPRLSASSSSSSSSIAKSSAASAASAAASAAAAFGPLRVPGAPALAWGAPLLPAAGSRPPARAFHAAAACGATMLVFGGQGDAAGTQLLSDVWALGPVAAVGDLPKAVWTERVAASAGLGSGGGGGAGAARPLRGHRLEIVGASLLLAYGGQGGPPGGLMTLDLASAAATWAVPSVAGSGLGAPFRAAVALLDADGDADPELVVFGGASLSGGGFSGGLAVLRQLGADNSLASSENLPFILGGGASALLLLGALALAGFLRSRRQGADGGLSGLGGASADGAGIALFEQSRRAAGAGAVGLLDYSQAYQATSAEERAGGVAAAAAATAAAAGGAASPVSGYREARRFRERGGRGGGGGARGDGDAAEVADEDDETSLRF